jgi:hypothetical protein
VSIANLSTSRDNRPLTANDLGWGILWLLWQSVRVPALFLLTILEQSTAESPTPNDQDETSDLASTIDR